jgi:hypothetical protein
MLLREDEGGVLAIGQPAHAWVSGQLARAWGNEGFGEVRPYEEVCLAAEQHDVGWAGRDLEPLFHRDTGLPRTFMEMPLEEHLRIWTEGPDLLLAQSRYAALLASMHGRRLYERRDLGALPAAEATAIRDFIDRRREFEETVRGMLADRFLAGGAAQLERNSLLIWAWDYMSLALCLNWSAATAKGCPTADARVDLELRALGDHWEIQPWPFATDRLTLRCEGRRLAERYEGERELRVAFERAPWETLEIELHPA